MKITPRLAITLTFLAFGVVIGGHVGAIPLLKERTGVDSFIFGVLAMASGGATILAMSLGGVLNRRFDHRSMLLFILPVTLATYFAALSVQSAWSFGATFVLLNLCAGTMDLFMNAEASVVEHDLGKPVFASFHSAALYAMGGAGFISGYISAHFGTSWAVVPAIPVVAAAIYAVARAIPHHKPEESHAERPSQALPIKILVLIGAVLGLDVAAEITCLQWSGQLLAELRPELAAFSGLGVGFFGFCSGTMRAMGDRLRARFGDIPIVSLSFVTSLAGMVVLALHPGFAVSVAAFALTGCGLALIFPCMFSVAAHLAPDARAAALGLASAVSGPPRIFLPLLLGYLAQGYGLSSIYVATAIAMAVALGFTWWTAREIAKRNGAQQTLRPAA